jgi:hypothetical protein
MSRISRRSNIIPTSVLWHFATLVKMEDNFKKNGETASKKEEDNLKSKIKRKTTSKKCIGSQKKWKTTSNKNGETTSKKRKITSITK